MTSVNKEYTPNRKLLEARLEKHWSQRELAAQLGTTFVNVSRWERGITTPGAYYLQHLCRFFNKSAKELGFEREESDTGHKLIWHMPFQRNPFFTGRESILDDLHRTLHHDHTVVLCQSYTVSGLGGVGKTQTAIEYAYRYADDYAAIFWMSAETAETMTSSCLAIADLLNLPEKEAREQSRIVTAVTRWLSSHDGWLLIFDNVEDVELIKSFVPPTRHGSLLFTTRRQALGMSEYTLDLETMTPEEGLRFLLHRARLLDAPASLDSLDPQELAVAQEIVAAMDGLPLALDQAGAYIEATHCYLLDYLHLLHRAPLRLLDEREAHAEHPQSVTQTFVLTFEQLERHHPQAAELLTACTFLAPEAIPEAFFLKGARHLGPTFEALAADPFEFQAAIKALLSYSLLRRQAATHTLAIHRLVQSVLKSRLSTSVQRTWVERLASTMASLFPSTKIQVDYWQAGEQLLPHALVSIALSDQWHTPVVDRVSLRNYVANYLYQRSRFSQAEALYRDTLQIAEQEFGPEHPLLAKTFLGLGNISKDQGEIEQAERLYQRALHIREHALGLEDPEVASILNNLANLSLSQVKYAQAEQLHQRILRIREQALGPENPLLATTLSNLGNAYMDQEKYEQAEPLVQRALRITEQSVGPEHTETAFPLTNLAEIYKNQGNYAAALPYYQRALRIREQTQGPEHPDVAYLLNGLADLRRRQGRYEEAEHLFQRALHIWKQTRGEHIDRTYALHGLATLFSEQHCYEKAEELYQSALCLREQHLVANHPLTAETLYDLAGLYAVQGRYSDALPLYQRALAIYERSLGLEHQRTVETCAKYTELLNVSSG